VIDWLSDAHTLTLRQSPPKRPNLEDSAKEKAHAQAYQEFPAVEERWKAAREARTYLLEFLPDGSFQVPDVPPGTYELSIQVNNPGKRRQFPPLSTPKGDLASLTREVVIPPGDSPFDLGTVVVPVKSEY